MAGKRLKNPTNQKKPQLTLATFILVHRAASSAGNIEKNRVKPPKYSLQKKYILGNMQDNGLTLLLKQISDDYQI